MLTYGSDVLTKILFILNKFSPYDVVERCVLELTSGDREAYTMHLDESEGNNPDVLVILIKHGHNICFHIVVPWGNDDIENAKALCSQAVLHRTEENDADLYFAVFDIRVQAVYFCLCSPSQLEFEDVSQHIMQREVERMVERLKTYIVSNSDVLS